MEWVPLIGDTNDAVVLGRIALIGFVVLIIALVIFRYGGPDYEKLGFYVGNSALSIIIISTILALFAVGGNSVNSDNVPIEKAKVSQPARLPESVFRGLDSVRVEADLPDGSRGSIVLYGKRSEDTFSPVAYRARFRNLSGEGDTAFWELSLLADRSDLAIVRPRNAIRADGRWQEGRTTFGSFSTSETAKVYVTIGDKHNWVFIPIAL